MNSLQRDPTRFCASVYIPIEIGEKIVTVIQGEKIERKTRACIHGMKRRKNRTKRDKTIGDFLVECAIEKTREVIPSSKGKKWGRMMLKKNMEKRAMADSCHNKSGVK